MRAGVDRVALGERQITVDCDVLQADGGTRCAAITGGWVALRLAVNRLMRAGDIKSDPLTAHVAAVSCGLYGGVPVLDLDYAEDSAAGTDANFVMTDALGLIEVQGSAEGATFTRAQLGALMDLAEGGIAALVAAQKARGGVTRRLAGAAAGGGHPQPRQAGGDRRPAARRMPVELVSAADARAGGAGGDRGDAFSATPGSRRMRRRAPAACRRWPTTAASRSTRSAARRGCTPPTGPRRRTAATSCRR